MQFFVSHLLMFFFLNNIYLNSKSYYDSHKIIDCDVYYIFLCMNIVINEKDPKEIIDSPIENFSQVKMVIKDIAEKIKCVNNINTIESLKEADIATLKKIYRENFKEPTSDLEKKDPKDFNKELSKKFPKVENKDIKIIIEYINENFRNLCYKTKATKKDYFTTIIPLKNSFFISGGRFKELYYWDTFFTIEGLFLMEMYISVFETLENLLELLEKYGYIPNGNRTYYIGRSQPPFFSKIIDLIFDKLFFITKRDIFDLNNLRYQHLEPENFNVNQKDSQDLTALENEFVEKFDQKFIYRIIKGLEIEKIYFNNIKKKAGFNLNTYSTETNDPRLESLRFDLENKKERKNKNFYKEISSACFSGWDFSSRWCSCKKFSLETTNATDQIAVDLNTLLLKSDVTLNKFYKKYLKESSKNIGNIENDIKNRIENINNKLFNEKEMNYNDFNVNLNDFISNRIYFSNFFPIFLNTELVENLNLKIFSENNDKDFKESFILLKFVDYLLNHKGGIPASSEDPKNSENYQWDYPNTWAPLVSLAFDYFINTDNKVFKNDNLGREIAFHIAKSFYSNFKTVFKDKRCLYEKYNCNIDNFEFTNITGEYKNQKNFAWTSSLILKFIKEFGDSLEDKFDFESSKQKIVEKWKKKNKI